MRSFWKNIRSVYKHTLLVSSALVLVASATFSMGIQTKNAAPASAVNAQVAHYADRVVARGYLTVLGRNADQGGRNYWYVRTIQNPNADWLAQAFMSSAEYKKGSLAKINNTDYIHAVYKRAMKRQATAAEITWWTAALKNGSANRAKIAGFVIENGFTYKLTRPVLDEVCLKRNKKYDKWNSAKPLCKGGSAGTTRDVVLERVPESNFYVNKAWVKNISDLRFEAARAGHYLVATSSYRTYEEQVRLFNMYGYPRAAYPGTSMHEWGLAIDFRCAGRDGRVLPMTSNSACLNWMHQNAARFGVYNASHEPWHWSSNGR